MLDTCGNVQDALQGPHRVRIQDDSTPNHFLIGDADGNCVAIEWLDGELVVHAGEGLPVKAMTNMPYSRALAAYERGGAPWWWSNPGQSAERFAAAEERNRSYDLDRDGDAVGYAFGTLVEKVAVPHTRWTIVYDIARREVWWGSARSRPGKHLSLHAFDLSCDAPLLMLDVNTLHAGDVEDAFVPYDRGRNLAMVTAFCDRHGIEISTEDALGLVRHVEGFHCDGPEVIPLQ